MNTIKWYIDILIASIIFLIFLNLRITIPVLTITDASRGEYVRIAGGGAPFSLSFRQSIYMVSQTEHWTVNGDEMRLKQVDFGSFDAAIYYDPYIVDEYKPVKNSTAYTLKKEAAARQIVINVTPASLFCLSANNEEYKLYENFHGQTIIRVKLLSPLEYVKGVVGIE